MNASPEIADVGLDTKAGRRTASWIIAIALVAAAILLFTRLGHYALWDDETWGALGGKSVLYTGDTKAMIGHNFFGYHNGLVVNKMRTEGEPPFSAYLVAPFLKVFGENSLAVRLPYALFGLATVAAAMAWMWKWKASPVTFALFAIALLGNVSFFLYCRQGRYYAPVMFFYLAIAYLYLHWEGRRLWLLALGGLSALLMSVNYTFLVLLYACLVTDYAIWQRKVRAFKIADLAALFALPFLMGLIMLAWWNPFHTPIGHRMGRDSFFQHIVLYFWHWRDLNRSEMIVGVLLLFTPWIAYSAKNAWLRRSLLAIVIFSIGLTALTIQSTASTSVSDVRYFSPVLLLFLALEVFTLRGVARVLEMKSWSVLLFAVALFGTNFFHGGLLFGEGVRCTPSLFVRELAHPPDDPYTAAANWINANVREGESIWVMPEHMAYPLMFHAPKAIYAWQLDEDARDANGQFTNLPPIHFKGVQPPDYAIFFGPVAAEVFPRLQSWSHGAYRPVALLDIFWKDAYRPELFWRSFKPLVGYDRDREAIYILKRTPQLPKPSQP